MAVDADGGCNMNLSPQPCRTLRASGCVSHSPYQSVRLICDTRPPSHTAQQSWTGRPHIGVGKAVCHPELDSGSNESELTVDWIPYQVRNDRVGNKNNTHMGVGAEGALAAGCRQCLRSNVSPAHLVLLGLALVGLRSSDRQLELLPACQFSSAFRPTNAQHQFYPGADCLYQPPTHLDSKLDVSEQGFLAIPFTNLSQFIHAHLTVFLVETLEIARGPLQVSVLYELVELLVVLGQEAILEMAGDLTQLSAESLGKVRHFRHDYSLIECVDVMLSRYYVCLRRLSKGYVYAG